MSYQNVLVQREDNVGLIFVNRPQKGNALNAATMHDLIQATREMGADSSVRVVIYSGAGEKFFVAGDDIEELSAVTTVPAARDSLALLRKMLDCVSSLEKPSVMAVNGYALGAGCELALAGDIRVASDTARLGLPEINMGLIPGGYGTVRLPRLTGKGAAKLVTFTGDYISAQEALRMGFIDQVVPAAELRTASMALARRIAAKSPTALALIKKTIDEGMEMDAHRAGEYELAMALLSVGTEDNIESTAAFIEKRTPKFKGR